MDWVGWALLVAFVVVILLGLYKIAQSPKFWLGLILAVLQKVLPLIWFFISKPETPEDRKRRQEAERRGEEWNPITKRPRER